MLVIRLRHADRLDGWGRLRLVSKVVELGGVARAATHGGSHRWLGTGNKESVAAVQASGDSVLPVKMQEDTDHTTTETPTWSPTPVLVVGLSAGRWQNVRSFLYMSIEAKSLGD